MEKYWKQSHSHDSTSTLGEDISEPVILMLQYLDYTDTHSVNYTTKQKKSVALSIH